MRKLSKLILLSVLIGFTSCQNESIDEQQDQQVELKFKDGNVVSDGLLEKDELVFTEKSELLSVRNEAFIQKSASTCTPDLLETGYDPTVNIEVISKPGTNGYFDVSLDGGEIVQAYCSDRLPSLSAEDDFLDFSVISSYDDAILAGGAFESVYTNPQNFDKVNWILNNIDISDESVYTYGHVQYAIWKLIEGPFYNDFTDYLTPTPGDWVNYIDDALGDDIYDLAVTNGEGYTPSCGGKLGLLLIPANPDDVQSILVTRDLPPAVEECDDCLGKVTDLTLKWDWHNDYRVRVYQRYENSCYAVKVFDSVVGLNDEIAVSGVNSNGTFGKYLYIYVGNCYYTKIKTNCNINIGPGYKRGVLEVVEGQSSLGGELCEYVQPHNYCYWW